MSSAFGLNQMNITDKSGSASYPNAAIGSGSSEAINPSQNVFIRLNTAVTGGTALFVLTHFSAVVVSGVTSARLAVTVNDGSGTIRDDSVDVSALYLKLFHDHVIRYCLVRLKESLLPICLNLFTITQYIGG